LIIDHKKRCLNKVYRHKTRERKKNTKKDLKKGCNLFLAMLYYFLSPRATHKRLTQKKKHLVPIKDKSHFENWIGNDDRERHVCLFRQVAITG
jgi:hypothetical protein